MSNFDYEAFIFWDVILVPAVLAAVSIIFAAAAYYDMRRGLSNNLSTRLYLWAFLGYLVMSVVLVVGLTVDLWVVAKAMEGRRLGRWVATLFTILGYMGGLSLVLAVATTICAIWLRVRERKAKEKDEQGK